MTSFSDEVPKKKENKGAAEQLGTAPLQINMKPKRGLVSNKRFVRAGVQNPMFSSRNLQGE